MRKEYEDYTLPEINELMAHAHCAVKEILPPDVNVIMIVNHGKNCGMYHDLSQAVAKYIVGQSFLAFDDENTIIDKVKINKNDVDGLL